MTDLDNFKRVNDSYGHMKGDEVINVFTEVLTSNVRSADFVARYGGEEFLVILPETTRVGAEMLAERIREAMQARQIEGIPHPVTASFGVTVALASDSLEGILQRADQALYQAKGAGRNRVVVI
jgi:diguanylate cyclase